MTSSHAGVFNLDQVVDDYLSRHRRGEKPSIREYLERHPEHAEEIQDVLQALEWMEDLGPLEQTTSPGQRALLMPLDTDIPSLLGDYRLIREIGRGGMGVVYEAVQESLGRHVALKVLPPQFVRQGNYIERFRREAQAAARLHHTNIVPVFGVGEQQGVYFYAMQFIQGQTLASVLEEVKRLRAGVSHNQSPAAESVSRIVQAFQSGKASTKSAPLPADHVTSTCDLNPECQEERQRDSALRSVPAGSTATMAKDSTMPQGKGHYYRSVALIARQVAHALAYAHERGIMHRDIKPNNLLIDERGTAWVTDFGLAKELESNDLTATGDIVGTLRYMAPELLDGKCDHRADIYGLGITLYEMATLRPAYDDKNRGKLVARIRVDEPIRPRRIDPQIPLDLETILLKASAKEARLRYQTAMELAQDLELFLADRPIQARRIGWWEQGWRWCRRNPVMAGMTATVLCLVVLLATVSSVAALWLGTALNNSEGHRQDALLAKQQTQLQLSKAYLAEAQANRFSKRVGQRFHSLATLKQSHDLLGSLKLPSEESRQRRAALRNEAAAALVLPDIRKFRQYGSWPAGSQDLDIDGRFQRYVRSNNQDNSISVRLVENDEELFRFTHGYSDRTGINPVLSPDGNCLVTISYMGHRLKGWTLHGGKSHQFLDEPAVQFDRNLAFSPDSTRLAFPVAEQQVVLMECSSGERRTITINEGVPYHVSFHPSGEQLAVAIWQNEQTVIGVISLDSGRTIQRYVLPHEAGMISHVVWNPDGQRLAAAGVDEKIYLWRSPGLRPEVLAGHKTSGISFAFSRVGNLLASVDHAGQFILRDIDSGHILLNHVARWPVRFSPDDRFLVTQRDIWELAAGQEYRSYTSSTLSTQGKLFQPHFDQHSRVLTVGASDGPRCWDLTTRQELFHLPWVGWTRSIQPQPGGTNWFSSSSQGIFRWKWKEQGENQATFGQPELISLFGNPTDIECSNDGKLVVQAGINQGALVHHLSSPRRTVQSELRNDVRHIALHPDGKLAAACSWNGTDAGVQLFDTSTGKTLRTLPVRDRSRLAFSPNGNWLLTLSEDESRLWEVGTWQCVRTLGYAETGVFSSDSQVLALGSRPDIRLVDPSTGQELVRLEDPYQQANRCLSFNGDASLLAATGESSSLRVWDLRAIREQLSELGLDWATTPYGSRRVTQPLSAVAIDLGNQFHRLLSPEDVITVSSLALTFQPFNIQALYGRAVALHRKQRNEEALADLDRILQIQPRYLPAHYSRGYILRRMGENQRAIASLSYYLRSRPRDLSAVRERAYAYEALNDQVRAVADWRIVCSLDSGNARAHNNLAWNLVMGPTEIRNPAEALPYAERAYQLSPNVIYRNTLSMVYYRLQQHAKAIPLLEMNAKEQHAESGMELYLLALCHHYTGNHERASEYLARATAWQPGSSLSSQQISEWKEIRDEARKLFSTR